MASRVAPLPVLAIAGLAKELRLAAGPGVVALGGGGDPRRLRALLDARLEPGCRAVVSFGIGGGLDPALVPGDLVVATGIIGDSRYAPDPVLAAALLARLRDGGVRALSADLVGVGAPVLGVAEKATLHRATGAAIVDMESHVAAAFARRHGLPFAAIRAVCDPADRALPAFVATALKPNGDPDVLAVLAAVLGRRVGIGELIRLARDSSAAFAALTRCRRSLGAHLGVLAAEGG